MRTESELKYGRSKLRPYKDSGFGREGKDG